MVGTLSSMCLGLCFIVLSLYELSNFIFLVLFFLSLPNSTYPISLLTHLLMLVLLTQIGLVTSSMVLYLLLLTILLYYITIFPSLLNHFGNLLYLLPLFLLFKSYYYFQLGYNNIVYFLFYYTLLHNNLIF